MRNYEATCLFDIALDEEKIDSIVAKFENKIKSGKGEFVGAVKWGKKRLAYTFPKNKKIKEANYVLVNFKGDNETLKALEDSIKYAEGIIRYRIINAKPQAAIQAAASRESTPEDREQVEVSPDILISADEGNKQEDAQS